MGADNDDREELSREVAGVPWYHTIELPGGITTPGRWDTRPTVRRLPLPDTLDGMRCLDIGTYDGFWAFEMERRGAKEVVALDVSDVEQWDWPIPGLKQTLKDWKEGIPSYAGFEVAHRARQSQVKRMELSVYDITPERLGMFDFVLLGDLLPHLRDPVGALTAIRSVCGGQFLSADVVSVTMTLLRPFRPAADLEALRAPFWWTPNAAARKRMLSAAGFAILRVGGPYFVPRGAGAPKPSRTPRAQFLHRIGLPHLWALAVPEA